VIATIPDNKKIRLHRLIINASEGDIADHISRNKLDNRKINIRLCTSSQNSMNRSKLSTNTSGHTGVGWSKNENMWKANICVEGKRIHLGYFTNIESAIKVREDAEHKYFKEYAIKDREVIYK